ncbi:uncharacterized protein LOC133799896 [Humulus lupulus]|uniref:uncharacterized protein LOC133799896 n=1 Tax=Humulus lupulus TaxID=3486 RepID=UPI002B407FA5|nr:uncharacterized protein LOC133799896 [Humulus lupulus]
MGPQRRLGIYVGYESPSIIKYLEPTTGDIFTARFADCHFDETSFPALGGGEKKQLEKQITWNAQSLYQFDPCKNQCKLEVQRIIHLQNIANQLPDAFTNPKKITKSHISAENAPVRIEVPKGQFSNETKARLECGRPVGSKDKNPRKRKGVNNQGGPNEEADNFEEGVDIKKSLEEIQVPENIRNNEISINYVNSRKEWD